MKMAVSFYASIDNEETLLKKIEFGECDSIIQEVNEIVEIGDKLYKIKGRRNCYGDGEIIIKYLVVENDKANWDLF